MNGQTKGIRYASPTPKKKKRLCLLWLLLLPVVAAALWFFLQPKPENTFFDGAAIVGTLPGKTDAEIQAELNQVVEEGMFNICLGAYIQQERSTMETEEFDQDED